MGNRKIAELEIRSVESKDLEQYNELLAYSFQVTGQVLRNSGYRDGEIIQAKGPVLERADVIGWFNDAQLISQLSVYPCSVNIHGRTLAMGGLTGVGTYPEYAELGLMGRLIQLALRRMRERGQWISYLYPYSVPYYRKRGWEFISDWVQFSLKDTQIPYFEQVKGFVERLFVDDSDVLRVYESFAEKKHGAMIRQPIDWEEYWRWENEEERTAAVYYDEERNPLGVLFYWLHHDVFHIKEMFYLNQEARKGLWNFISAHFSMVDQVKGKIYTHDPLAFWLEDSHITETIEPYYMARIVDVEEFLKVYPFGVKRGCVHFVVTDPLVDWNNGTFSVSFDEKGETIVSREAKGLSVVLTIQTLTSLLMSYRSPRYFYEIERIQLDEATLELLEEMIPPGQAYFSDYF